MKRWEYIIATIALSAALPAHAQTTLTLDRCRELAIENNKRMVISAENGRKATYDVKTYRANFFPKLSATGNYLFSSASMKKSVPGNFLPTFVPDPATGELAPNILTTIDGSPIFKEYAYFPGMDFELQLNGTYMAGLQLEQPVYMGGKVASAYKMSKIGEEMAALAKEKTRAEVILQSDEAYWTYTQTLELATTARAYEELVARLLTDVDNAFEAGMKPRNDVLKVQVKLNEANLQRVRAENAANLARMNLCHVVGMPLTSKITVEYTPDIEPSGTLPEAAVFDRPEYAMLEKQVELKEQQVRLARSEFLPSIGIAGTFGYANGLKLNGDKLLDNTSFSAMVSVSVPLFHWSEGRNRVGSARTERNIAALQRDEMSEQMELELQQARNAVQESKMEVTLTLRSLDQAEENMRESKERYEAGMETMSDLLEAQTLWQRARSELIRAQTSSRLCETRYLIAAGKL